ncbi:MAG: GAF domain-containing protein [Candidatus Latescibacteria bacterium]|nr:GAF domain-containing protein [Candidatus Latescibacterota bacterium]
MRIVSVNRAYCERRGLGRADLEGRNVREVFPDSILLQDDVLGAISTAIREGRSVKLENVLRPREFMNKVFNMFITGVERGPERQALVVFEDITEVVERAYQLSMLRQVIGTMQGILDLDRLLYAILTCVTAGTALGFNRAILLLVDRKRDVIEGKIGVGPGSEEEASHIWRNLAAQNLTLDDILRDYDNLPDKDGLPMSRLARRISIPLTEADNLIVRAVQEQRAIRVTDAYSAPEVSPELRDVLGVREFVCVPLIAKEKAVGAIIADNLYSGGPISDEGVHLLTAFASQAGLAVENAEVYAQLGDKIQELEEAYRKLHQAQDDLVRSERLAVIGEMSARMAHEIRNPLATIGGFARAIARKTRPDRVEASARVIVEEVERLENLLAETLNFTRPTLLDLKPTALNDLAEAVFGLLKEAIEESHVTVERRLEPDLPSVVIDAAQVKQVLLNLFQNALQAMPDGGALKVCTHRMNGAVEVIVEDTGVGISPEDINHIFSPFFTTKTSGTGLGLAISRKIISDHAGDIAVTSQPGVGTTVTVRLPLKRNET